MILTLLHPRTPKVIRRWRFRTPTQICVGRSHNNHVVLPDLRVSRYHLELHRVTTGKLGEVWQLRSNAGGTFLDDKLISQAHLNHGSTIRCGLTGPRLRFELQPFQHHRPIVQSREVSKGCNHRGTPPGHPFCIHCGQSLRTLKTIRYYQVLRLLGQGGMGKTFLVRSRVQSADYPPLQVLKQMHADMVKVPKARELFDREARVLRSLHHPGIPQLFDAFVENQRPYLVMEWIQGQSLHQWVFASKVQFLHHKLLGGCCKSVTFWITYTIGPLP